MSAPARPEGKMRSARCLYCGWTTEGRGEEADPWPLVLAHDGLCPKNPHLERLRAVEAALVPLERAVETLRIALLGLGPR